jgi:transcriptional regulator with XRE-family HTH domain
VAVAAGISESALYYIEHGYRWPPAATILRLAAAMRLPVASLATAILQGWMIRHRHEQPEARP